MITHIGAVPMAHLDRVTRAKPVTPVTIRHLLRVPLSTKVAGANLTIVLVAWVVGYVAHRTGATDWRVLSVMTVALLIGLVVNLALIVVALRPIRDLEQTATRVWAGDLETRVPQSLIADAESVLEIVTAKVARDIEHRLQNALVMNAAAPEKVYHPGTLRLKELRALYILKHLIRFHHSSFR